MAFESYTLEVSEVGSFLSSRYQKLSPQHVSASYYGTTGSVLIVVER